MPIFELKATCSTMSVQAAGAITLVPLVANKQQHWKEYEFSISKVRSHSARRAHQLARGKIELHDLKTGRPLGAGVCGSGCAGAVFDGGEGMGEWEGEGGGRVFGV